MAPWAEVGLTVGEKVENEKAEDDEDKRERHWDKQHNAAALFRVLAESDPWKEDHSRQDAKDKATDVYEVVYIGKGPQEGRDDHRNNEHNQF